MGDFTGECVNNRIASGKKGQQPGGLMTKLRILAAIAIGLFLSVPRAGAQSSTLNAELLKDWTEQKTTMMKIADAMPEDKFAFKTTAPQRDYGQQIMHVAGGNVIYLQFMGAKAAAPAINRNATTKADILKALSDSYDYGTAVIREQTDQSMLQTVATNQFLGTSTRARVIYFLLGHSWDIYGQMAVYLRLNGVVPPRSQRP
jgi:uncharacterized damage-inducible protein DinB